MLSLLFPADQPQQTYRLKRVLLGLAFYSTCTLVMGFGVWYGLYPPVPLAIYTLGFLLGSAVFFAVIRLGWNLHFKDPSLTALQIAYPAVLNSYMLLYAGPFRGDFLLAYVTGLMFGGTNLTKKQLIWLGALQAILFPVVELFVGRYIPQPIDWRVEFVNWISYCVVVSFTLFLIEKLRRIQISLKTNKAALEAAMTRLTEMAVRDELTGLYNRRHVMELLETEKRRSERNKDAYCVCLFDLDHFKRINDTYGHGDGDTVLRTFAEICLQCLRGTDILARWGGEEFLLLVPQATAPDAEIIVKRIMRALEKTAFDGLPAELRVTISVGIAQYRMGGETRELIECADKALYSAKRSGRNRVVTAAQAHEVAC